MGVYRLPARMQRPETLLDLCAVPWLPGPDFDGASLAPLLRGQSDPLPARMLVVRPVPASVRRTLHAWFQNAEGRDLRGAFYARVTRREEP